MCLKTHPTNEPSTLPSVHPHIHQRNPTKVLVCLGLSINCLFAERRGDSFISRDGVFKRCILEISQSPFHGSIEMTGFCPMSEKRSDEDPRSWQEEPSFLRTRCFAEFILQSPRPKGVGSEAEWDRNDGFPPDVL